MWCSPLEYLVFLPCWLSSPSSLCDSVLFKVLHMQTWVTELANSGQGGTVLWPAYWCKYSVAGVS